MVHPMAWMAYSINPSRKGLPYGQPKRNTATASLNRLHVVRMAGAIAPIDSVLHQAAGEGLPPSTTRQREGDVLRQYYVAVDRHQYKMVTLMDLLDVLGRKAGLPLVICCNARDSLDAVFAAICSSQQFVANFLHSDLDEDGRAATISQFRSHIVEWNNGMDLEECPDSTSKKPHLLVISDACLPSPILGEQPLAARLLINYDLPLKKESYMRRMATCLSLPSTSIPAIGSKVGMVFGGAVIINFVVGGEVAILRSLEEGCGIQIDEMPINVSEML